MDHSKRKSIHHQMMTRRASRSEYKDGLLRHNQRQENRLALELEQWEKAQRTVARGLEKESQWFKQTSKAAPSSSSPSSSSKVLARKNSLTDADVEGGRGGGTTPRFIPDYQYRTSRTNSQAQGGPDEHPFLAEQGAGNGAVDSRRSAVDEADSLSARSHHKKNHRPAAEGEGAKKSGSSSRHHEDKEKKSSRKREDGKKRDPETKSSSRSATTTITSTHTAASGPQSSTANDKPKASSKPIKKHQSAIDTTTSTTTTNTTPTLPASTTAATNTATNTSNTAADGTTKNTTEDDATTTTKVPKTSSSGARAVNAEVHDPGDVFLASSLMRDLGLDRPRRYRNVWDNLNAPKHSSQARSVRTRLQREFTVSGDGRGGSNGLQQPSSSSALTSSKGFGSARKSGRAPSWT